MILLQKTMVAKTLQNPLNVANRSLFVNDNIHVLRGINSESVDLIYIDPPFNKKRIFEAPIGSKAAGASFEDAWTMDDVELEWIETIKGEDKALYHLLNTVGFIGNKRTAESYKAYLQYMAVRLIEMHRVLKSTGSIYVHCDPTMSHYLKMVMDCIFDKGNFRNEVVWSYRTGGSPKSSFSKKHDIILFYSKTKKYVFHKQQEKAYTKAQGRGAGKVVYGVQPSGKERSTVFYEDDEGVYTFVNMRDVWDIPYINSQAKERTGYPTQKPLALLERIIKASSDEGDMVLDVFCGCATTLVAAEKLGRQWIGCDISEKAGELVEHRMKQEAEKADSGIFEWGKGKYKTTIRHDTPKRTDIVAVAIDKGTKQTLYQEQDKRCGGCEETFDWIGHFEIDHKTPRSKGGGDNIENLQLLCGWCNRTKGNRDMVYLKARIKEMRGYDVYGK